MPVKFNVKITDKHILDFQLYHGRTKFSSIFGVIAAVVCFGLGVVDVTGGNPADSLIWFVCCGILLIFPRQQLKAKAKKQAQAEMFQLPLEYEFSDEGITTRQGELEVTNKWDAIVKAVSTKKCIILYMSRVRAMIFPKECIGENYEEVVKLIRENVPAKQVKIR